MVSPHLPIDFDVEDDLLPHHLEEWATGSGVAEAIVRVNVRSYTGEAVHELLIGDRLEQAGAHGHQYVTGPVRALLENRDTLALGGWAVQGIDLQNGCHSPTGFVVFKPDRPRVKKNGRAAKYEHSAGIPERIVALRMPGDDDYWARIKADPSVDIVLDESGGKKLGAWLTAGIPALGVPGIWAGTPPIDSSDPEPTTGFGYGDSKPGTGFTYTPKKRTLHSDLAVMAPGRRFVVSFDHEPDAAGQQRRDAAVRILVEQLYAAGASCVAISHRRGPKHKGADDLLVHCGPEALQYLFDQAEDIDRGPIEPSYQLQRSTALTGSRDVADLLADHIAGRIFAARQYTEENNFPHPGPLDHLTNTPGAGKTHLVPQVGPRLLEIPGIDRVIYVSSTYRSPSIPELHRWIAPPSRHDGLVVVNIDGHQRLRRRKKSDEDSAVVEQANCQYSRNLQRLRNQGASPEAISHFCHKVCPARMGCKYLRDQHEFLAALNGINQAPERLFRCPVESIPTLQKWLGKKAWANTYLIFDEAPQIESASVRTREIKLEQFTAWGTYLRTAEPAAMATPAGQQLTALLDALATLSPADKPYGLTPQQLIAALPPAPDLLEIFGDEQLDVEVDLSNFGSDEEVERLAGVPLMLTELIRALRPPEPGKLMARAFFSKDIITLLSGTVALTGAALSAAGSLVLDGTALTADINHELYGGWPAMAPELAAQAINTPSTLKLANLEIIQIPDLGPMGRNRGKDIQRRLEALLPAIAEYVRGEYGEQACTGVLEKSHFRSRESGHGIWFVDNQGSNAYQHDQALVMVGCPAPNLTASLANYQVTHFDPHATLNSSPFRRWYAQRMGEQIIQGLHRLRPIRRQGETLLLFLITSTNLSGLGITSPGRTSTFKQRNSGYFTKAAAPKKERTRDRVITAIRQIHAEDLPPEQITTRMVAAIAQCSQTTAAKQRGELSWLTFVDQSIQ